MRDFHGDENHTRSRENPSENTKEGSKHKKQKNAPTNRR
jgi:hypothetical protein